MPSVHNKMKWFQQCDTVKKEDKLHILLPFYCLLQSCRDYNKSRRRRSVFVISFACSCILRMERNMKRGGY